MNISNLQEIEQFTEKLISMQASLQQMSDSCYNEDEEDYDPCSFVGADTLYIEGENYNNEVEEYVKLLNENLNIEEALTELPFNFDYSYFLHCIRMARFSMEEIESLKELEDDDPALIEQIQNLERELNEEKDDILKILNLS